MDRDIPQPEGSNQEPPVTPEQPIPDEILIPKEAAKAFGRALDLQLTPHFKAITHKLDENPNEQYAKYMRSSLETFRKTVDSFNSAKEVKIIARDRRENYSGQWDFEFTDEDPTESRNPQPGLTVLDETILEAPTSPFSEALNHRLGNEFVPVLGYSELLSLLGDSENKKTFGKAIHENASGVVSTFEPIMHARRIEMTTDEAKNTTMNIIPKENPYS